MAFPMTEPLSGRFLAPFSKWVGPRMRSMRKSERNRYLAALVPMDPELAGDCSLGPSDCCLKGLAGIDQSTRQVTLQETKSSSPQCKASFYPIRWLKDVSLRHDWIKFGKLHLFVAEVACHKESGFRHLESKRRTTSFANLIGQ